MDTIQPMEQPASPATSREEREQVLVLEQLAKSSWTWMAQLPSERFETKASTGTPLMESEGAVTESALGLEPTRERDSNASTMRSWISIR